VGSGSHKFGYQIPNLSLCDLGQVNPVSLSFPTYDWAQSQHPGLTEMSPGLCCSELVLEALFWNPSTLH
jgi:hypothetical protein